MEKRPNIIIPTRPQPDTIVAIFLLKTFGEAKFSGIGEATVSVQAMLSSNESFDTLTAQGIIPLDIGGGPLDHHGKEKCASELVADFLDISNDPSLSKLLAYAKRDDKEGKGTISSDPLDRAFGLSGLIASLNKIHTDEPQKVVDAVLPLLDAQFKSSREHRVELPQELEEKKKSGEYQEIIVRQSGKPVKIAFVISDKPAMPTFLRSWRGPRADVVVQKSETKNHVCIVSRQERGIDLSKVAGIIRLREAELRRITLPDEEAYVCQNGRIKEMSFWYVDPATNSILNGGTYNPGVDETNIPWNEMKPLVRTGVELGTMKERASYYLAVNIGKSEADKILSSLQGSPAVRIHENDNLHVTLEFLSEKTEEEASQIAEGVKKSLAGEVPFSLVLSDTDLRGGSPEGYTSTQAWYLSVEGNTAARIEELRKKIFANLGLPYKTKELHVTLASKRDQRAEVTHDAVSFGQPFEIKMEVNEIVLMKSTLKEGKRIYRSFRTFPLA